MSRLRGLTAGIGRGVRRVNVAGVARLVLVAGAGVALVYVATDRPVGIDLVAATGESPAPLVGTSLATRVALTCPGPELAGIPGTPDVTVPSSITVAAGPAELLPVPASGSGRLTARSGPSTLLSLDDRPGSASAVLPGKAATASGDVGPTLLDGDGSDGAGRGRHPGVAGRHQGPARPGDDPLRCRWLRPVADRRWRRARAARSGSCSPTPAPTRSPPT